VKLGLLAAAALLVIVPLVAVARRPAARPPVETGYVDDRGCAACHAAAARAWSGSHHARAMQVADVSTVLGDFEDARITHFGVTSRFFRRDGRYVVATDGPDGRPGEFEIRYAFGVAPLQQYLVELPGGRLQALTIAWDTTQRRWFDLYPDRAIPAGHPLHWTGRYQNWNLMCGECHTTNFSKGYDAATDTYRTTWAAINVGCQACHGPGAAHVRWARGARAGRPTHEPDLGLSVTSRHADWRRDVDACGRCHARRVALDATPRADRPFLDDFRPASLRADLYHADGQQSGEAFEWGSFLQSRMYQVGVRCTDCHDAHAAARTADDALCTRCHREAGDPRFPMLRARRYDSPAHHHHAKPGSAGARCVACHMPAKRYMVVDPRRDHSLRVPRPDLTVKLGTPNACNGCHADRPAAWAVAAVRAWYGNTPPAPHYGEAIAAGRGGARDAVSGLVALATATAQPAIVRATALDLLHDRGTAGIVAAVTATHDDDPLVRMSAAAALERLSPAERIRHVGPLLADPVRAVRIEAARALAGAPEASFDPAQRRMFAAALADLRGADAAMADMPSSHVSVAMLHERRGEREAAVGAYTTALAMDPRLLPARTNLASLYSEMGRNGEAERLLRDGLALTPEQGQLHYALGLLLADEQRLPEAVEALGEAARLMPDDARVRYNGGLALERLGRLDAAEGALVRATELAPDDPQIVYALATLLVRRTQYRRALDVAEHLTRLAPEDPAARRLADLIRQALRDRPSSRDGRLR
jgi:Flp pilus assembly protein TadD